MSVKENAAISLLLELLESRYALRVLWALKDGHPQTFRLLQDSIKELRAAGLLGHGDKGYTVTPLGADLLKRLNDLQAFAGKWVVSQTKVSAAGMQQAA